MKDGKYQIKLTTKSQKSARTDLIEFDSYGEAVENRTGFLSAQPS